jgi:exonuclease VII large subunit
MPRSGVPGRLYQDVEEELQFVSDRLSQYDFGKHAADLNTTLTTLQARSRDASIQMEAAQKDTVREAQQDLQRLAEWPELTQEEQSQTLGQLDDLLIQGTPDLKGLKQLLGQEYVIGSRVSDLKKHIEHLGRQRRLQRLKDEKAQVEQSGQTKLSRTLSIPAAVTSAAQLESLIQQLQTLKDELALYSEIEVMIVIEREGKTQR